MNKELVKTIRRLAMMAILATLLLPKFCLGQTLGNMPLIYTPKQLSSWLTQEFRYEMEMPDYWQSAQETLKLKKGDCEDFAILSQEVLKSLKVPADILIIKFKGLNQSHAVCIFKNDQYYSFFSNQKLVHTKADSIAGSIQEQYPDWESITFTNSKKENLRVVVRAKMKYSPDNELVASSNK